MRDSLLVLAACVGLFGCDANTLGYVEKEKYDTLQKRLEKVEADLNAENQQVSECQAHKYEVYREGWRTWRLDTVTGATCLLLAPPADWKKAETVLQSCN